MPVDHDHVPVPVRGTKVVTLTVLVNDHPSGPPLADAITSDALGDTCRDLMARGVIWGFNFTGGVPADHVVGINDVKFSTTPLLVDTDELVCVCGNTAEQEGFWPCDEHGTEVEPKDGAWDNLWFCDRVGCGRILEHR